MGAYDSASLYPFDNEVLETKIKNQLTTKLDMYQFATVDNTLAEGEGMVKKIRTYVGTGDVEDVAMGYGNTGNIGAGYVENDYRVQFTQGRFPYYDEQALADARSIDAGMTRLSTAMINDVTSKVIGEFGKAVPGMIKYGCTWTFDNIVDAIAMFPDETVEGLFLLVNKAEVAALRKNLKDSLQYVEAFVRTGYIGSVAGVPVYESAAVPAGMAYLANKEAVTAFAKEGVSVSQERNENTRQNTVYARRCSVIALTDASKLVRLTSNANPTTGYTVLTTAPLDWATDWDDYFTYNYIEDKMEAVTGDAAPDFVAGKYYSKNA